MNNIESFVIAVCSAMIIGGIVFILRPTGNLQTTIKTIIALFVVFVCLSFVVDFDDINKLNDFSVVTEFDKNSNLQDYINNEILVHNQQQLASKLGEILAARGVKEYSIKFILNDNHQISHIDIYTKQKNAELKKYLESELLEKINIIEE